jgi:hypothetical protein
MSANGQQSLINTHGMTSAREMRALHRARRKPELEKMRKPIAPNPPKRYALPNHCSDIADSQFAFPEEDRIWPVWAGSCPECRCKGAARLERRTVAGQSQYRLHCSLSKKSCSYHTPWLNSSAMAIQHWKVTAALSK